MGDGPPPHPRSRGTRLTVPGVDAGSWRELQAAVSRGEASHAGGRRSVVHLTLGPLQPHPHQAPAKGRVSDTAISQSLPWDKCWSHAPCSRGRGHTFWPQNWGGVRALTDEG